MNKHESLNETGQQLVSVLKSKLSEFEQKSSSFDPEIVQLSHSNFEDLEYLIPIVQKYPEISEE
jgi:flagellar capping protein FliD